MVIHTSLYYNYLLMTDYITSMTQPNSGFSIGYFLYDIMDMALYNPKRSTYELLFHHACVIACFGISASSKKFIPYACISLMIEINSIFLHLRQLLIIKVSVREKRSGVDRYGGGDKFAAGMYLSYVQ